MAPSKYAATFRSADGELLGTTDASTACLAPIRASTYLARNERDDEVPLRCGFCLGCRELDRRRLHRRLYAKYRDDVTTRRWAVRFPCPFAAQPRALRALHRRKAIRAQGMYRRGRDELLFITEERPERGLYDRLVARFAAQRAPAPADGRLAVIPDGAPAHPAKLSRAHWVDLKIRGERAFGQLTAGMLLERECADINRYYHRGLPPREKTHTWHQDLRRSIRRAITDSAKLVADGLHPEAMRGWFGTFGIFTSAFRESIRLLRRPRRNSRRARFSSPEALSTILENSFLAAVGEAGASARRSAGVGAYKVRERDAGARTASSKPYRNEISGRRYSTSRQFEGEINPALQLALDSLFAKARGRP